MSDRGILSSLRYLFADVIGDDDAPTPFLPEGLPEAVVSVASEAIHMLIEYQGPSYAQLYVDRLKRFIGRRGFDDAVFAEVARLLAARMSYEDPIRIAQLTLAALDERPVPVNEVKKFRIDELVGALPAIIAEPVLDTLEWLGWLRLPVSIRFNAASRLGIRRLKIEAGLKRWRLFSVRYPKERAWVERWLHMIDRSLTKQPNAAPAIVHTADMISGYGDPYRQGMADWNVIMDGLAKPTFDGVLDLADLGSAVTEARAAVLPDPRQAALKRKIAEIRARAPAETT
ncbi:MAG TPA: DUF6537 domain-containing protein [Tepidisphaeraceae bacterium]|nr:DUF6537 domain-containing protein [Tepidisphaeraceae bacterium]